MAGKYAIETVFSLIDRITAPTSKINKALDSLGIKSKAVSNALKNDFDKASDRVDRLGNTIKKTAGYMAAAGVAAVGAGLAIATKQFVEFDDALHKASAVFSDLNPKAEDFERRIKSLGVEARKVAAATEFNAQQTASALATMAMAGIKSDQAIALLPKVANMATAAGVDIDKAVGMAADSLNVFGKMSNDPLKLANNLQYVSDIMVKTASLANMDISMMYEAIGAGGRDFKNVNQRIEDFGAAVDVLAANGIKGAEAGNSINKIFLRLSSPVGKAQDAIEALGLRTKDSQGNLLNFVDIIDQLHLALKDVGTADKAAYIDAIIGKNHYAAASALIDAGKEGLQAYSKELDKAAGATVQMANVMRSSLRNRIEVLKSSLMELGFKFVDAFAEKGGTALGKLTEAINSFDVTPFIGMAESAIGAIQGFGGFLMGALKIAWQFRGVIIAIAAPLLVYHGVLTTIIIATSIYNKFATISRIVTGAVTGAQIAYAAVLKGSYAAQGALSFATKETVIATKIWTIIMQKATKSALLNAIATKSVAIASKIATAAQWAFNVALTANPIGIVIVAIGALIAIIVLLAKNWDKVTAAVKNNINKVMFILSALFGPIGFLISMIKEVASNWTRIKDALAATGLFDKIKEIGAGIKNFIQPAMDWFINVWTTVKNAVAGFFNFIIGGIQSVFAPAINWVINAWQIATSKIGGFFKEIFSAVYNFVKPAFDFFVEKWEQIKTFFKDNAIVNAIKVIGGTLISGLLAPVQGLLEILSYIPGLGHLAGKGAEKIEQFRNFLKDVDGATVTAEVNPPENVTLTPPVETGVETVKASEFDMANFAISGAEAGKEVTSKLHGVVDISGGATVNPLVNESGTYTVSSAAGSGSAAGSASQLIPRNLEVITAVLRKIDGNVYSIANRLPELVYPELARISTPDTITRTNYSQPRIRMNGEDDDIPENYNPRNIAPITQAERLAYSVEERIQRIIIEVAAEKGTAARIVRAPRDAEIELTHSGGNS